MNSNAIVRINSWCALKSLDPLCLTYIGPVVVLARELIHYPSLFGVQIIIFLSFFLFCFTLA